MKGLRTRSLSDRTPTTMRAMMSAPQNQVFSPFTCAVEKLVSLAFWKVTA